MSLINLLLELVYCSNLVSNYSLIRLIRLSRNLQANYAIHFLFRLDLLLHTCKIIIRCDNFEILNFVSKQEATTAASLLLNSLSRPRFIFIRGQSVR